MVLRVPCVFWLRDSCKRGLLCDCCHFRHEGRRNKRVRPSKAARTRRARADGHPAAEQGSLGLCADQLLVVRDEVLRNQRSLAADLELASDHVGGGRSAGVSLGISAPAGGPDADNSTSDGGLADFASIGSVGHGRGECQPCIFWFRGSCAKGEACTHCHSLHPGQKNKRIRPSKKTRLRIRSAAAAAVGEVRAEESESSDPGEKQGANVRLSGTKLGRTPESGETKI